MNHKKAGLECRSEISSTNPRDHIDPDPDLSLPVSQEENASPKETQEQNASLQILRHGASFHTSSPLCKDVQHMDDRGGGINLQPGLS